MYVLIRSLRLAWWQVFYNKKTMSFKWLDRHMRLFLDSYRQHECLWNTKCSDYINPTFRDQAYASMVTDLNIPGLIVADVKSKIKTVRTGYVAQLSKIKKSEKKAAGPDEIYEPRLFWFKDADSFLRDVSTSKPRCSFFRESRKCNTSSKATNAVQPFERHEQQTTHVENNDATSPKINKNSGGLITQKIRCSSERNENRKRSISTSAPAIKEEIKKLQKISDVSINDPNEFDVFCESLAIQLKKMPLERALICQEKLQSVMTQERLSQLT